MDLNLVTLSGFFVLGIKVMKVWFRGVGSEPKFKITIYTFVVLSSKKSNELVFMS